MRSFCLTHTVMCLLTRDDIGYDKVALPVCKLYVCVVERESAACCVQLLIAAISCIAWPACVENSPPALSKIVSGVVSRCNIDMQNHILMCSGVSYVLNCTHTNALACDGWVCKSLWSVTLMRRLFLLTLTNLQFWKVISSLNVSPHAKSENSHMLITRIECMTNRRYQHHVWFNPWMHCSASKLIISLSGQISEKGHILQALVNMNNHSSGMALCGNYTHLLMLCKQQYVQADDTWVGSCVNIKEGTMSSCRQSTELAEFS